jgi:hypothetical protein
MTLTAEASRSYTGRLMRLGHTAITGTMAMGMRKPVDVGGVCMVAF